MAEVKVNPKLLAQIATRGARGLARAALHVDRKLGEKLSNSPPRHGRVYEKRVSAKGNKYLAPVPDAAVSTMDGAIAYRKSRGGRKLGLHISSAPGEPPALLWNLLRGSRGWRIETSAAGDMKALFGSRAPYARRLEKDMNRPAWLVTLEEELPTAQRFIAEELGRG